MEMESENVSQTASSAIRPIDASTIHRICSGQVVLNLAVAVKELVENSLDAGATAIDVTLKNYGMESIEVSDNGSGVMEENFAALTLKYHTSKLNDYSDLMEVSSFGFRGEALSSLCALSDLIITTRHKSAVCATKIEYDNKGHIKKKTPCSRQVGTTVTLTNLFSSLPVRQKEFFKNVKREFSRMTQLLYAYCLISVGVKITCTNQTKTSPKTVVVATQGSASYKENIASVFGIKQLQSILEIKPHRPSLKENILKGLTNEEPHPEETVDISNVDIDLSEDSDDGDISNINSSNNESSCSQISTKSQGYKNNAIPFEFQGFISSCAHGSGRSTTDKQFYFVNSRPCEPTKVIKLVNEVYRQFNPNQYPFIFLNLKLQQSGVDINVTPDKRKVFLTKEKVVLECIKSSLLKLFENIPSTLKVELPEIKKRSESSKIDLTQPRVFNSFLKKFSINYAKTNPQEEKVETTLNNDLKRKSTTILDFVSVKSMKPTLPEQNDHSVVIDKSKRNCSYESYSEEVESSVAENRKEKCDYINNTTSNDTESYENVGKNDAEKKDIVYLAFGDEMPNTQVKQFNEVVLEHKIVCKTPSTKSREVVCDSPSTNHVYNELNETKVTCVKQSIETSDLNTKKIVTDKEDLGKLNRKSVTMKTSIEHVMALAKIYNNQKKTNKPERLKFKSEINPIFNKKCEEELEREISKDSFLKMDVIGQFNLGFIITKLDEDLFIIDQHATDEIYNFETLQKTTELTSQRLVLPQQLDLTGVNEQVLIDNLPVFAKNGFTFEIDKEALPTKRVKLITIPMSKNWIFGKDDIEELLFMLREGATGCCRPSRVRAMFASRACRKSVMIGTALSKADMRKLVQHMTELDKPWNCPHGRPTIRHLVNLAMVHTE